VLGSKNARRIVVMGRAGWWVPAYAGMDQLATVRPGAATIDQSTTTAAVALALP